jgi:hypothetical protein
MSAGGQAQPCDYIGSASGAEMKTEPVREAHNRSAHATRSRHANWPELRAQAGIALHRVGHGSVGGCGKLLQSERHLHVQPVRQCAGEFGPALTADALGHHTCDKVAEVRVLEGVANVVARLEIAHRRQHLGG